MERGNSPLQERRVEVLAVAPGLPSIAEQERRDRVPAGLYQRLVDSGQLSVAHGLHVQPPAQLWARVMETWGRPAVVICDRFRMLHLRDTIPPDIRVVSRVTQWSDATFDIYSLRAACEGRASERRGCQPFVVGCQPCRVDGAK